MSAGQIVGGIVGFAIGGPVGAQIGIMAGGMLDPPKGPTIEGPRLSDLSFQSSAYGAQLARVYGAVPIVGNIFWLENNALKEVKKKKKSGGKGGPSTTTVTYSYYATFAVALADTSKTGPVLGIRRIWIGSNLVYNAGSYDLETILASMLGAMMNKGDVQSEGVQFKFYSGTDDQMPDPRMQADIGVDDCPAYRRTAYIVFNDLALEKYGNSLQAAQVKVEVITAPSLEVFSYDSLTKTFPVDGTILPIASYLTPSEAVIIKPRWTNSYPASSAVSRYKVGMSSIVADGSEPASNPTHNNPMIGVSDVDAWLNAAQCAEFGAPLDEGMHFVIKNGATYLLDDFSSPEIYQYKDGVLTSADPSGNSYAITVDGEGNIYCLQSGSILVLDDTLSVIGTLSFTAAFESYGVTHNRLHWDGGIVYIYFENTQHIYAVSDDGSGQLGPYTLDASTTSNGYSQLTVYKNVVSLYSYDTDTSTSKVDRFNLAQVVSNAVPLAEVVGAEMQIAGIAVGDIDVSALDAQVRGYRISGGSIRSAIAPLQGAYPFDVIPSGYKIKCVPRGLPSVATIDIGELGAISGGGMVDAVLDGPSREMDTQLPRKVVIKCLDPERDYDVSEQKAERSATDSVNIESQELPLVMLADEAANMAQMILYLRWLERDDFAFTLPPTYNHLEPADAITVVAEYGSFSLRLPEINYGSDNVLQCKAKPNAPAIYTPNAVGGQGAISTGTIALNGLSTLILIDGPLLPTMTERSSYIGVMGSSSSGWLGGAAMRSTDGEINFDQMESFSSFGTYGTTVDALSADGGFVVDYASTLIVWLECGTLESITVDQLLAGRGLYAYGADGRWEILAVANAVLQVDGSYLLSTFLRGCYGTEWATGLHQVGDDLVYLEDIDNLQISFDDNAIGVPAYWRGITSGQDISSASSQQLTYGAVLFVPLSPVNLAATRNTIGDYTITWNRRSRKTQNWFVTGVDHPLAEASESYIIEIYSGASVIRTLTATTNSVLYTNAQQLADFGSGQNAIAAKIYQISEKVGRGYAASATITPSPSIVASLLLHFNGANGSTTIIDDVGHVISNTGVTISTAQSQFGGASGLFNGTSAYISAPTGSDFRFPGNFTVEGWAYPTSNTSGKIIYDSRISTGSSNGFVLYTFNGVMNIYSGGVNQITSGLAAWALNAWHHWAVSREGNSFRVFIDGVLAGTWITAQNFSDGVMVIGRDNPGANQWFSGYIDEVRIANSSAIYNAAFTPPAAPF